MSITSCGVNENGTLTKDRDSSRTGHIGDIIAFYGSTAPEGTLVCNGAAISRTTYSELFGVIGTTAGAGDGSTTFNLPDLRGLFLRGLNGTNAAALGVEQGDAIRNITASLNIRAVGDMKLGMGNTVRDGTGAFVTTAPEAEFLVALQMMQVSPAYLATQQIQFDASNVAPTAAENRPVNTAVLYCMIYE